MPADFMKKPAGWSIEKVKGQANKVHPANEMKEFFLKENSTFVEHLNLQKNNYPVYVPVLLQLLHHVRYDVILYLISNYISRRV